MSAQLGSVYLSGLQTAILRQGQYIPEHQIPGREGGITDNLGLTTYYIELHGFMESGDSSKQDILNMKDTQQSLLIPSVQTATNTWFGADVIVKDIQFVYPEGRAYPYYEWIIRTTYPSTLTAPANPGFITRGRMSGISYASGISIMAMVHLAYVS